MDTGCLEMTDAGLNISKLEKPLYLSDQNDEEDLRKSGTLCSTLSDPRDSSETELPNDMKNKKHIVLSEVNDNNKRLVQSFVCEEPWNYKILLLLQKIGRKTMGYRWMHEQEAKYYNKMNTRFNICERLILVFLGTITGAGFVNFLADTRLNTNSIIYIVITVIQLVTVSVAAIIKEYRQVQNYQKQETDHSKASLKSAEINLEIQYQLALNVKDRESDKCFLNNVLKKFNDTLYLAPKIKETTKKKYIEETDDNDIFSPIMMDHEGKVQIVIKNQSADEDADTNSKLNYGIERWLKNF